MRQLKQKIMSCLLILTMLAGMTHPVYAAGSLEPELTVFTTGEETGNGYASVSEFASGELSPVVGATVSPGNYVVYQAKITNNSEVEKAYTVYGSIPAGTILSKMYDDGTVDRDKIQWNFTLAAGASKMFGFKIKVTGDNTRIPETITYKADWTESENPKSETLGTTQVVNVQQIVANMYVYRVPTEAGAEREYIEDGLVKNGDHLVYDIEIRNTTNYPVTYDITSLVPDGTQFEAIYQDGTQDGNNLSWHMANIPANESTTVGFKVKVTTSKARITDKGIVNASWAEGAVTVKSYVETNMAAVRVKTITGDVTDNNKAYNTAYANDVPSNTVATYTLETHKNVYNFAGEDIDGECVAVGNVLEYRITVKNVADVPKEFTVTDEIPGNTILKAILDEDGALQSDGKTIKWTRIIPARYNDVFSFQVTTTEEAVEYKNQAKVKVDDIEIPTNETENRTPKLHLVKIVRGVPAVEIPYNFEVDFSNVPQGTTLRTVKKKYEENGSITYTDKVAPVTAGSDGKVKFTFYLENEEEVAFLGISEGMQYQVKEIHEAELEYVASYEITDSHVYNESTPLLHGIVMAENEGEDEVSGVQTEVETVDPGEEILITFNNTYFADLTIEKIIQDYGPFGEASFFFDIKGVNEGNNHVYHLMLSPEDVEVRNSKTHALVEGTDIYNDPDAKLYKVARKTIKVALGVYEISERSNSRYKFAAMTMSDGITLKEGTENVAVADFTSGGEGTVSYINDLDHWEKTSHSVHINNHIGPGEPGKLDVVAYFPNGAAEGDVASVDISLTGMKSGTVLNVSRFESGAIEPSSTTTYTADADGNVFQTVQLKADEHLIIENIPANAIAYVEQYGLERLYTRYNRYNSARQRAVSLESSYNTEVNRPLRSAVYRFRSNDYVAIEFNNVDHLPTATLGVVVHINEAESIAPPRLNSPKKLGDLLTASGNTVPVDICITGMNPGTVLNVKNYGQGEFISDTPESVTTFTADANGKVFETVELLPEAYIEVENIPANAIGYAEQHGLEDMYTSYKMSSIQSGGMYPLGSGRNAEQNTPLRSSTHMFQESDYIGIEFNNTPPPTASLHVVARIGNNGGGGGILQSVGPMKLGDPVVNNPEDENIQMIPVDISVTGMKPGAVLSVFKENSGPTTFTADENGNVFETMQLEPGEWAHITNIPVDAVSYAEQHGLENLYTMYNMSDDQYSGVSVASDSNTEANKSLRTSTYQFKANDDVAIIFNNQEEKFTAQMDVTARIGGGPGGHIELSNPLKLGDSNGNSSGEEEGSAITTIPVDISITGMEPGTVLNVERGLNEPVQSTLTADANGSIFETVELEPDEYFHIEKIPVGAVGYAEQHGLEGMYTSYRMQDQNLGNKTQFPSDANTEPNQALRSSAYQFKANDYIGIMFNNQNEPFTAQLDVVAHMNSDGGGAVKLAGPMKLGDSDNGDDSTEVKIPVDISITGMKPGAVLNVERGLNEPIHTTLTADANGNVFETVLLEPDEYCQIIGIPVQAICYAEQHALKDMYTSYRMRDLNSRRSKPLATDANTTPNHTMRSSNYQLKVYDYIGIEFFNNTEFYDPSQNNEIVG